MQELRPQFLPARPARHPFSFPPSSQSEVGSPARHYAGRRMTEPVGLLSFHSPSWSPVATSGPGTGLCTPCALDLSISVY